MILCCGEALIDMLPRTSGDGEACFMPCAGGAVFNTAIALGRLDVPIGFFSGLSDDLFGDILRDTLAKSGVDASPAHVAARPTTLAFVTLTDGQASYAFYDENTAGRMLQPEHAPEDLSPFSALFFGGISLAVEPCGTAYEALLDRACRDHVIMIDPNIRPGFIRNPAAYRAKIERMISQSDIVKLSDEDLHWLFGQGDLTKIVGKVLELGPKLVCITEGARGATAYTRGLTVRVAATPVKVADTVGAGDTFNAGILASLHDAGALTKDAIKDLDADRLRNALDLATRCAAVTVSRAGANPPRRHEL